MKRYLSNLQPYQLSRKKEQEKQDGFLCVLDNMYRVSVYIKVDTTQGEEIVVSFHEDNKAGVAKSNHLIKYKNSGSMDFVAVFANNCGAYVHETGFFSVDVLIQRGLRIMPVTLAARKYGQIFVVRRVEIDNALLDYCNTYLMDLYNSDLNLDFSKIDIFSSVQQVSFTLYGQNIFETISLLIDSLCIQDNMVTRTAADFALVTYAGSLKLTPSQKKELAALLDFRYAGSSIKAMPRILERVKLAIR